MSETSLFWIHALINLSNSAILSAWTISTFIIYHHCLGWQSQIHPTEHFILKQSSHGRLYMTVLMLLSSHELYDPFHEIAHPEFCQYFLPIENHIFYKYISFCSYSIPKTSLSTTGKLRKNTTKLTSWLGLGFGQLLFLLIICLEMNLWKTQWIIMKCGN